MTRETLVPAVPCRGPVAVSEIGRSLAGTVDGAVALAEVAQPISIGKLDRVETTHQSSFNGG